jgi:hypothetical protein
MDITKKIIEKIKQMVNIKGFYITEPGDPSVGIYPATWKLEGEFIFDNEEELESFRTDLKKTFENYCGEFVKVETIDEIEKCEREFDFLG